MIFWDTNQLGESQNGLAFPQIHQFQQESFLLEKATLHSPAKTIECPLKRGFVQRERRKSSKFLSFFSGLCFVFLASISLVVGILPSATPFRQRHCCVVDVFSPGISCWVVRVHPAVREIRMLYRRELGWCAGQPAVEVSRYTPLKNERKSPQKGPYQKEMNHLPTLHFQGIWLMEKILHR